MTSRTGRQFFVRFSGKFMVDIFYVTFHSPISAVENSVEVVENSVVQGTTPGENCRILEFMGCQRKLLSPCPYSWFSRWATTRAAFTPEAPAWARPRVTPAPSPTAKKPGRAVSSSWESLMRAE